MTCFALCIFSCHAQHNIVHIGSKTLDHPTSNSKKEKATKSSNFAAAAAAVATPAENNEDGESIGSSGLSLNKQVKINLKE